MARCNPLVDVAQACMLRDIMQEVIVDKLQGLEGALAMWSGATPMRCKYDYVNDWHAPPT